MNFLLSEIFLSWCFAKICTSENIPFTVIVMHIDDIANYIVNLLACSVRTDQYRGVKCIANYVLDLEGPLREVHCS